MSAEIEGWNVYNVSRGGDEVPIKSISHAVSVLMDTANQEIGETIEFKHRDRGLICCTAGRNLATIRFAPDYSRRNESLLGSRGCRARRYDRVLPHADSNGFVSSIPPKFVLPIVKVVRALVYILETFDFPPFIDWSDPLEEYD
jgi:hypothetical protein